MIYYIWLIRIVHIVAGVFWVGGTLTMTFFVAPTIGAIGEAGQKFVGHLMNNLRFSQRMSVAAGLTGLAGILLYWHDSDGFTSAWMHSGAGAGFGIGAAFGVVGFAYGLMVGRVTKSMAQHGGQMQGKPTPEQMTEMKDLQGKQGTYSKIAAATLILSLIFMSIARYMGLV
jgi:hypothetical protein